MRSYALVLGAVATAGSAYVANMAVSSAGVVKQVAAYPQCQAASVDPFAPTAIWYGGTLEPVTITARALPGAMLVTGKRSRADTTVIRLTM